jgi:predicted dienelactone hydrolase
MVATNLLRRAVLLAALGLAACVTAPAPPPLVLEEAVVQVEPGRQATVKVWRPANVRGVVLFSHGGNAQPDAYGALASAWADAGFLVAAPVHVDSLAHPDHAKYSLQSAFPKRIADLRALSAWAARQAPGRPVAAAGHSYGSVIAAMAGGALADRGGVRDPSVRAVVMLSSPGAAPGLITPAAYATLQTPLLVMTGDADVVQGFVSDWRAHLIPFETSPGGEKYAVIRKGGDHEFGLRTPASPAARDAIETSTLFLEAYGLGDLGARRRLDARVSTPEAEVRRR